MAASFLSCAKKLAHAGAKASRIVGTARSVTQNKKAVAAIAGAAAAAGAVAGGIVSTEAAKREAAGATFYLAYGKRLCDIAIGIAALPVVGAVTAVCGTAIKLEDGGPIFYNAPRVGKNGVDYTMYKLRSMKVNAPALVNDDGTTYNGPVDPRITKVGAFMRARSLDEIPQFLNVLKGDMSVVGPRPNLRSEADLYEPGEERKLTMKPGVTGYAAVHGRNALHLHDRIALDLYYVDHASFKLDAQIFLQTFGVVFKHEDVYTADMNVEGAKQL